jgi:hypothetical protein
VVERYASLGSVTRKAKFMDGNLSFVNSILRPQLLRLETHGIEMLRLAACPCQPERRLTGNDDGL